MSFGRLVLGVATIATHFIVAGGLLSACSVSLCVCAAVAMPSMPENLLNRDCLLVL
jgi:hypothetical protein